MEIDFEIINAGPKILVGRRLRMNRIADRTPDLWRSFMPAKRNIQNTCSDDLLALTVYDSAPDLARFDPEIQFDKWATLEVTAVTSIPSDMEQYEFRGGLYAVFKYKGSSHDHSVFQYIFGEWLPSSDYVLDSRPHVEVLGSKYKNGSPDSEEDIWIPIAIKQR